MHQFPTPKIIIQFAFEATTGGLATLEAASLALVVLEVALAALVGALAVAHETTGDRKIIATPQKCQWGQYILWKT